MHALRTQAESRVNKVAVCWYDQSYDMYRSYQQKDDTTRRDGRQEKKRRK